MDPEILVALIAACASLIAAALSLWWGHRNNREIETLKEEQAEKQAWRDYQYEARKRLYEECGPLFFQFHEAAEDALHRIYSLARTANDGRLGHGENSWVSTRGYYTISTYHKLFAPLTYYRILRRRLTIVDLSVDPYAAQKFDYMKLLFQTFTSDFILAEQEPELPYDPNVKDWVTARKKSEATYWRQALAIGRLEAVADSLIVKGEDHDLRVMSFSEFEASYLDDKSELSKLFTVVDDMFDSFEPMSRPILWRILVVQAHIYSALIDARKAESIASGPGGQQKVSLTPLRDPVSKRLRLNLWNDEELGDPQEVASAYLKKAARE